MLKNYYGNIATSIVFVLVLAACGGGGGGSNNSNNSPTVSSDSTLSDLSLSAGALTPAFQAGTTTYTLAVENSIDSITVTPTTNEPNATVVINGVAVNSGSVSSALPLAVGNTPISVTVTAQDGVTTQIYSVVVTRQPPPLSGDASLTNLILTDVVLAPAFNSAIFDYSVTLPNAIDGGTLVPVTNDSNATVTVNGAMVLSGEKSDVIKFNVGSNSIFIVVTAEDGTTAQTYTITVTREPPLVSIELLDPTPGARDRFGTHVVMLKNGNVVITDPSDSSRFSNNGAVHLYTRFSPTPIASIYGNAGGDLLGSGGITSLQNSNFVVRSPSDNEGGVSSAGSVRLVDGDSGIQIGPTIAGDNDSDSIGSRGVFALANNNYVISSPLDNVNGLDDAGSVRLVDGTTGMQIGSTLVGDNDTDRLGSSGIRVLNNGNYVVASSSDSVNGVPDAGSVRLMDGSTGGQIGTAIVGDNDNDFLGSTGVTALNNSNYVIVSQFDRVNNIGFAGSVLLIDGSSGLQIGSTISGDNDGDLVGFNGVIALANNNYVIASQFDSVSGVSDGGSVRLVDGSTGVQIGGTLAGETPDDQLGSSGTTALGNNNFVVVSRLDDENGVTNAGSVRLVDGSTGVQIGSALAGDDPDDQLGSSGVAALGNNNFVIASPADDESGIVGAGSVRLVNGETGIQIGATLAGETTDDALGSRGITALGNNNYVIASPDADANGLLDAGTVRLVDGSTGLQIGAALSGDTASDFLGNRSVVALGNDNYVVVSDSDDENGVSDAGSVRLLNGSTGVQIGNPIAGENSDDMSSVTIVSPQSGDYYILAQPSADVGGLGNAGRVRIVVP